MNYSGDCVGDRLRHGSFQVRVDLTIQINYVVYGLDADRIGSFQRRVLTDQRTHVGRNFRITRTAAESTFPVLRAGGKGPVSTAATVSI
jgi:hypothetical protein